MLVSVARHTCLPSLRAAVVLNASEHSLRIYGLSGQRQRLSLCFSFLGIAFAMFVVGCYAQLLPPVLVRCLVQSTNAVQ